jgi:hypothetical protein
MASGFGASEDGAKTVQIGIKPSICRSRVGVKPHGTEESSAPTAILPTILDADLHNFDSIIRDAEPTGQTLKCFWWVWY